MGKIESSAGGLEPGPPFQTERTEQTHSFCTFPLNNNCGVSFFWHVNTIQKQYFILQMYYLYYYG